MARAKALDTVATALELVGRSSPPLYSQMDCQAFVEYCVNQHGSPKINYRGSNDMIRNACSWVGTLEEAKKLGYLCPGVWLFILKHDGKEPDRYKSDGIGNSNHVGIYTGTDGIEVVHSSASRGKVAISTLKNAWNRVGIPRDVFFDWWEDEEQLPPEETLWRTLRFNDTGMEVMELQQRLLDLGFDIGKNTKVDGKFGKKTKEAVEAFQRRHGLRADGIVGPDTWEMLREQEFKPPDGGYDGAGMFDKITVEQFMELRDFALGIGVQLENISFGEG